MSLATRIQSIAAAFTRKRNERLIPLVRTVRYYLTDGDPDRSVRAVADLFAIKQPTGWQKLHQLEIVAALQHVSDQIPGPLPSRAEDTHGG